MQNASSLSGVSMASVHAMSCLLRVFLCGFGARSSSHLAWLVVTAFIYTVLDFASRSLSRARTTG